ncbi:hypothetical protein [Embleya sp. AB8]|uniref:hypothetical protein n=1 Tax=Embleya sp. AB8 TaxID=3156304 RepID=UPI003C741AB0
MRSSPGIGNSGSPALFCGAVLALLLAGCAGADQGSGSGPEGAKREQITSLQIAIAEMRSSTYKVADVSDASGELTVSVVGDLDAARRDLANRYPQQKITVRSSQEHVDLIGRIPEPTGGSRNR